MPIITQQPAISKLRFRMQQVCIYRVRGQMSDAKIAEKVGLSLSGLQALLKHPEYVEMEEAEMAGSLSELEKKLSEDKEALRQEFKYAVPAALTALVQTVKQNRDLRAKMAAAKEILNRDPDGLFRDTAGPAGGSDGSGAPTLPSGLLANLNAEGNRTVTQIKETKVTTKIEAVSEMPPEAGKHNA